MIEVEAKVEVWQPRVPEMQQANFYIVKDAKWELETCAWGADDTKSTLARVRGMGVPYAVVTFVLPAIIGIADPCL